MREMERGKNAQRNKTERNENKSKLIQSQVLLHSFNFVLVFFEHSLFHHLTPFGQCNFLFRQRKICTQILYRFHSIQLVKKITCDATTTSRQMLLMCMCVNVSNAFQTTISEPMSLRNCDLHPSTCLCAHSLPMYIQIRVIDGVRLFMRTLL